MSIFDELATLALGHGHLPEAELRALSERTLIPLHRLQAVSSFFPHLAHTEAGQLRICTDLPCKLAGAENLLRAAEAWAAKRGIQVEPCACLGRCDKAPALIHDGKVLDGLKAEDLGEILEGRNPPEKEVPPSGFTIDPYRQPAEHYSTLRRVLAEGDPMACIQILQESGLRGMGGAGFPTGLKWKIVREAPGDKKHVVVNGDESEPGTFKDRFLLRHFPHLMVEGALLGAWVTGARTVTIFVRHEYGSEIEGLKRCVEEARAASAIGARIFGSDFSCDVEVFTSPGGYICGEETALLEALSERRAEPRNKPPFPGNQGLWNQPTLINNVETLSWIPAILSRGSAWWKAQSPKLVGLSGHVARPGVYQVPLGMPIREILERFGGGVVEDRELKAFSPGGASSGFLPAAMIDLPFDFKPLADAGSMLGSGALVFIGAGTCMVDAALSFTRFFRDESCGKCVPCRCGTAKLVDFLERATRGEAGMDEIPVMEELSESMLATSICGLGQAAPLPLLSLIRHFREEFRVHLEAHHCPEGTCDLGRP